jgi:hypothetical protein
VVGAVVADELEKCVVADALLVEPVGVFSRHACAGVASDTKSR